MHESGAGTDRRGYGSLVFCFTAIEGSSLNKALSLALRYFSEY